MTKYYLDQYFRNKNFIKNRYIYTLNNSESNE